MKHECGYFWPDSDRICPELLTYEVLDLQKAIDKCKDTRTVVQAGGNVGVYPAFLSMFFDRVWTFEPDRQNFACLMTNTSELPNIFAMPLALAEKVGEVGVRRYPENCGATHITDGKGVITISLDQFELEDVDLIQLDVEGFEYLALLGAYETIMRFRPVLMLEDRGHGDRYGSTSAVEWAKTALHYKEIVRVHHDVILVPND